MKPKQSGKSRAYLRRRRAIHAAARREREAEERGQRAIPEPNPVPTAEGMIEHVLTHAGHHVEATIVSPWKCTSCGARSFMYDVELPEYSVSQTGQDAEQPAAGITIAEAARSLTEEQWNRVRWTMALEDQGVPEIQCSCDGGAYFTEYQNRRRSPFIVNYGCPIHRR